MSRTPPYLAPLASGFVGLTGLALLTLGGSAMSPTTTLTPPPGQPGRFFTWKEFTKSGTASRLGIDNTPTPQAAARIRLLCSAILDPLRAHLGQPLRITSGYRHPDVNAKIKGSASRSQHMLGEAADFKVTGITAEPLAAIVVRLGLPFDQVIWYDPDRGGHVHISHTTRRANRGERLHAPSGGGYRDWSPHTS